MRTGFIGILNNPSVSPNSHSAGWNELVRCSIDEEAKILTEKDDWNQYDRLIINHGPNFKPGSYNVIGGISQAVIKRTSKLLDFIGEVYTFDGFQVMDFIEKRNLLQLGFVLNDWEIENISLPKKDKLVIGDSHAISVWPGPTHSIERLDGKTLWGFMKDPKPADIYYFGNIDARFHWGRQPNPHRAVHELVNRYIDFVDLNGGTITCLLPVESEVRKLPGTGLYKGQPYFGSIELRRELVSIFNNEILSSNLQYISWPVEWYMSPSYFETEVMEPRQSVHIRPKHYYATRKR